MKFYRLFDIPINDIDDDELDKKLECWIISGNHIIFTPNAEMLLLAHKKKWFAQTLRYGDLLLPDSISIKYAVAALTKHKLKNRHTGIDTLHKIIELSERKSRRIVVLGGISFIAKQALKIIKSNHPDLDIHFINPGRIDMQSDGCVQVTKTVIDEIIFLRPSVLVVALGHGKQESFILKYIKQLDFVNIAIGVGGAIDMIAGDKKRAPKLFQRIGFEWLWRLLIEPSRIGRILQASIVFPITVANEALKKKRLCVGMKKVSIEVFNQIFRSKK